MRIISCSLIENGRNFGISNFIPGGIKEVPNWNLFYIFNNQLFAKFLIKFHSENWDLKDTI